MRRALAALAGWVLLVSASPPPNVDDALIAGEALSPSLKAFNLLFGPYGRMPNARVTPYNLNTPLFSDYAEKFRFLYVPAGRKIGWRDDGVLDFPVGSVLIKSFGYPADMRRPDAGLRILETRLLIRRASGWIALPYVWNEAQTEARLSPIGADILVSFTDEDGAAVAFDWAVPNRNQCKGCHDRAGDLEPIGPSARNLNRVHFMFGPDRHHAETMLVNQLFDWGRIGILSGAPSQSQAPQVPEAYEASTGSLDTRARAYLDVNCAHCHNPEGPAHTSGLDLRWSQHEPVQWGVLKRPVAAGRGSAGYDFAIEPGHPERSILLYRMESTDPGVMMPELGRQRVDARGVALIRQWIAEMDAQP